MRRCLMPFAVVFLISGAAGAHPLADLRFDRTAAVRLSAEGIEVTYTLEVSSLSLHLDAARRLTPAEIAALDRTFIGYATVYARKVAPELSEKFSITSDGTPLSLKVTAIDVKLSDHATCRFSLVGIWPPGNRERKLAVLDGTFPDKTGVLNLTVDLKGRTGKQVELLDLDEPPIKIRTKIIDKPDSEEGKLARRAYAEIRLGAAIAPYPREFVSGSSSNVTSSTERSPQESNAEPSVNIEVDQPPDLLTALTNRGLPALFDSTLGIGVILLAAFLFGAAHAFTPGHGKTLVAAYLIGERGTVRHAVLLATVTTLTHTGSVIAVAAILWSIYGNNVPGRTQGALQFFAGLLVIGVGLWLLMRRISGQADHFHLFGGHHHHGETEPHSHTHDHAHSHGHGHGHHHSHGHHHHGPPPENARTTTSWLRIILMGLGGGIVPCWDAVLLLVAAAAMNRIGFAIPLLLAFSAGLGLVLVGLGVSVVYAYKMSASRFREQRWFQILPMVSAVFLVGVGFWLCKQAVALTSQ